MSKEKHPIRYNRVTRDVSLSDGMAVFNEQTKRLEKAIEDAKKALEDHLVSPVPRKVSFWQQIRYGEKGYSEATHEFSTRVVQTEPSARQ